MNCLQNGWKLISLWIKLGKRRHPSIQTMLHLADTPQTACWIRKITASSRLCCVSCSRIRDVVVKETVWLMFLQYSVIFSLVTFSFGSCGDVCGTSQEHLLCFQPAALFRRLPKNTERKRGGRRHFVHFEVNIIKDATLEVQLSAVAVVAYARLPGTPLFFISGPSVLLLYDPISVMNKISPLSLPSLIH